MKRGKKSYITFTIQHDSNSKDFRLSINQLKNEILNNLLLLFGQYNHLRLSKEFNILYYNSSSNYGIVQVNNDFYQEIVCCIILIRNLLKHSVKVDVIHIGRTLRNCKRVIVNNYLCSLESCMIHQSIYGNMGNSIDSAIDCLKSVSLIPH